VALLATPDSTFVFVNWTGSSTSTDNPLSVTIDADKSYTANFVKKQYPLTILIEGEGIVSEEIITNGRIEDYDVGTLVQLTDDPSEGWKFDQWIELDIDTNPIEVSITDSIILTARFYIPIDSVSITPSALQMILGAIDTLKADIYPGNISDTLNWISSDERIATVTQKGIVTALAKGETIITVITANDSITSSVNVVVSVDGDQDGVIDENDTCADTPEGATVDANSCADSQNDTDGDGVKDDKDTCADTPEWTQVDLNGCPMGSVWTGTILTFSKLDNTDPSLAENQDRITENVWITRNNVDGGQIYNAVSESASSKNTSPTGTAWAEGIITDYATLNYTPFRTATVKPKNSVGKTYVVHLIEDDIYLTIKILSWSSKKAGGFSYERSTE
jgi:uncharacterized repeat protein (TIGR02543 family)